MLTLGVDLSSQNRNTAICLARWEDGRCRLEHLAVNVGDEAIVARMNEANVTGIDAPFGWPDRFVAALTGWAGGDRWTETWDLETQRVLRLRETDRWLYGQVEKWPMSVSADSIAMCAMRAATLLRAATPDGGPVERVHGPYYEVYPGAALIRWGLAATAAGYKDHRDARERLVTALAPQDGWLVLRPEQRIELARTDHALDALLSALVARAAATGATHDPPEHLDGAVVAREGWIRLPKPGSLGTIH